MKRFQYMLPVVLVSLLAGCADPEDVSGTEATQGAQEAETFTATSVTINADGTQTVTTSSITRAEQLEMNRMRELNRKGEYDMVGTAQAALVSNDVGCTDWAHDLAMYDQPNAVGNMLCVKNSNLSCDVNRNLFIIEDVAYPGGGKWSSKIQSFYPGKDFGWFASSRYAWCQDGITPFNAWQAPTNGSGLASVWLDCSTAVCRPG